MKKLLKIIGIILGVLIILLVIIGLYINFSALPKYESKNLSVTITSDSLVIAEGRRMSRMLCYQCHMNENKLDGSILEDENSDFGIIWSKNITQHPEYGIGKYTDGQLVYLLRTGIDRNGNYLPPWMPKFPHLSDLDMNNMIAYLKSDLEEVQASDQSLPAPKYSFLTKLLLRIAFKPLPYDEKPIVAPDITNKVAYGRYLSTSKFDCFGCHSPDFKTQNLMEPEKTPGYFTGGNPLPDGEGNIVTSANLTPDTETGLGNWKEEDFNRVMKYAQKPDGSMIRAPMLPFPYLTDEEISTIWAYLQSLEPIHNDIRQLSNAPK